MAAPALVYPEEKVAGESYGGIHPTDGLPGYPAIDFFAPAGTRVLAPEAGTIHKLSGTDPSLGPHGTGKVFGFSEYLLGASGTDYFITHLGSTAKLDQSVVAGQVIGTVADFDKYGTPSHAHIGAAGVDTASMIAQGQQLPPGLVTAREKLGGTFYDPSGLGGLAHIAGNVASAPGGVAEAAQKAADKVTGPLKSIAELIAWITTGKNITRIAEVLAGALIALIGILALVKGSGVVSAAKGLHA